MSRDKFLFDLIRLIYAISLLTVVYAFFVVVFPLYFPAIAGLGVVLIGSLIFAMLLWFSVYLKL